MDDLTLKFLKDAVNILNNSKSSKKIDVVINQLRFKSLKFSTCVPTENNTSEVCMHCGNVWQDGLFSFQVKCHENNKIKRQTRKIDRISALSPCRREYMLYYKSQKDNILVKKCLVCKSISKKCMNKPFSKGKRETVDVQCIENQNCFSRKKKRKSRQSFAGLSPAAVFQARLSCTQVENSNLEAGDISNICEPIEVKNLDRLVKINPLLSHKQGKPDKYIPPSVSQNSLTLGVPQGKVKKQNLKNDGIPVAKRKSWKKKKKTFLSEVVSFL